MKISMTYEIVIQEGTTQEQGVSIKCVADTMTSMMLDGTRAQDDCLPITIELKEVKSITPSPSPSDTP